MGGGSGGGGSGNMAYPTYQQGAHERALEYLWNPEPEGDDDLGLIPYRAENSSPFEGRYHGSVKVYDPTEDLDQSQDQFDKFEKVVRGLDEFNIFRKCGQKASEGLGLDDTFLWDEYYDAARRKSGVEQRLDPASLVRKAENILKIPDRFNWAKNRQMVASVVDPRGMLAPEQLIKAGEKIMQLDRHLASGPIFEMAKKSTAVASELGLDSVTKSMLAAPMMRAFDAKRMIAEAEKMARVTAYDPSLVFERSLAKLAKLLGAKQLDNPTFANLLDTVSTGLKKLQSDFGMGDWDFMKFYDKAIERARKDMDFAPVIKDLQNDRSRIEKTNASVDGARAAKALDDLSFSRAHEDARQRADGDVGSKKLVDEFMSAHDASLSGILGRRRANIAAQFSDIGADTGASFKIANAIMASEHLREMSRFGAELRFRSQSEKLEQIRTLLQTSLSVGQARAELMARLLQGSISTSLDLTKLETELKSRSLAERANYINSLLQIQAGITQAKIGQQFGFAQGGIESASGISRQGNDASLRHGEIKARIVGILSDQEQTALKTRADVVAQMTDAQRLILAQQVDHMHQVAALVAQVVTARYSFLHQAADLISRMAIARVDATGTAADRIANLSRSREQVISSATDQAFQHERAKMSLYESMFAQMTAHGRTVLDYVNGAISQMGTLDDMRLRHRALGHDQIFRGLQLRLTSRQAATQLQTDMNRVRIVAQKEYADRDMEVEGEDAEWAMRLITQYFGPMLGAVGGGTVSNPKQRVSGGGIGSMLGGAMSGASTGLMVAGMLGAPLTGGTSLLLAGGGAALGAAAASQA